MQRQDNNLLTSVTQGHVVASRDLPNSIEDEQAILGACLIDDSAFDKCSSLCTTDFYLAAHQEIFSALLQMHEDQEPLDPITLGDRLREAGKIPDPVPQEMPFQLSKGFGTAGNVSYYVKEVRRLSRLRRTMLAAQGIFLRGIKDPSNSDEFIAHAAHDLTTIAEEATSSADSVQFQLTDIENPTREKFVFGFMIPFAKVTVFYGPSGIGKSTELAQLVYSFAAGEEKLQGIPLYPGGGDVLIYSAEDSEDDWKLKAAAVRHGTKIDMTSALKRFHLIDQSEGTARLSETVTERTTTGDLTRTRSIILPTAEQERIIAEARCVGAKLIVIETVSRLVDEEDNPHFAALIAACGRIARVTGAAVLITHHPTKESQKSGDPAIESARGGGALTANARNAMSLYPADPIPAHCKDRFLADDVLTLAHPKPSSSTRSQPPITLIRRDTPFGAVLLTPEEIALEGGTDAAYNRRLAAEQKREVEKLQKIWDVATKLQASGPISKNRMREPLRKAGIKGNAGALDAIIDAAIDAKVLEVLNRDTLGRVLNMKPGTRPEADGTTRDDPQTTLDPNVVT